MNFDGAELRSGDGPHAARRGCIPHPGRATVLGQFRVRGGGSRQTQAGVWEQRARSELEKPRTGQSGLRQALKTGVTWQPFSSPFSRLLEETDERYAADNLLVDNGLQSVYGTASHATPPTRRSCSFPRLPASFHSP